MLILRLGEALAPIIDWLYMKFGVVTGYKHTWKVPSGESANMRVSRTFEVCLVASGTLLEVPNSKLNWWNAYSCYIL
jgi:hypothetical protein